MNVPEVVIRGYDPIGDYADVCANLTQAGMFDGDRDTPALLEQYADSVIVAAAGEAVVGSVYAQSGIMPVVFRLVVRESHRNLGIGGRLLSAAEAKLRSDGHPDVELFFGADNESLQGFYARRGYQDGGTYKSMWRMID